MKWISVKDQLPDRDTTVVIWLEDIHEEQGYYFTGYHHVISFFRGKYECEKSDSSYPDDYFQRPSFAKAFGENGAYRISNIRCWMYWDDFIKPGQYVEDEVSAMKESNKFIKWELERIRDRIEEIINEMD